MHQLQNALLDIDITHTALQKVLDSRPFYELFGHLILISLLLLVVLHLDQCD